MVLENGLVVQGKLRQHQHRTPKRLTFRRSYQRQ